MKLPLIHFHFPELFRCRKKGYYSLLPFLILILGCRGMVALEMKLSLLLGHYPENGFAVFTAYWFGWIYILFTMIPIEGIYLILWGLGKFRKSLSEKKKIRENKETPQ